ncbi:Cgl0159 family (beta/alpha)8-fold protein [Glycomyces buryatensis]|uniref:Aldolase n=1 Tax=Glycomyces buryatensis TaxID=2570927 RepID=A0A4S8QII5_9ACTN|nr:aldolase [Glycomyces buryatensis]THV41199.1 aldolase [Glycomyces buryatensis]
MHADTLASLADTRLHRPGAVAAAAAQRERATSPVGASGKCFIIAADHPARGSLGTGGNPMAMADRGDLLDRLCIALANPGCNGLLATADIIEDLLLLGALDGKMVFGSMNRGGLAGSTFEIDDRFTSYDAATIDAMGFDGGKTLTRIALDDPATPSILENTAKAVNELAALGRIAMVEPFISSWVDGKIVNDLSTEAVIKSAAIASGLGATSSHTWLKLPTVPGMDRVAAASTLPIVMLGGEVADIEAMREQWGASLSLPNIVGLTVGRSLLYPADDDVAGAIDAVVKLL